MTEKERPHINFPDPHGEGWETKTETYEKVPAVDFNEVEFVLGQVIELGEVNVSKTDEPDMRVYADIETPDGKRRLWATTVIREHLLDTSPGDFICVRSLGMVTSKGGRVYRDLEFKVHGG